MKLFNTVLTLTLLFKFLQAERNRSYNEYQAKRATQQPLTEPLSPNPSKYTRERYKPDTEYPRPVYANGRFKLTVDDNGIITSMSSRPSKYITATTKQSKYTPEQLQSFYKINPYTNLDN